MVECIVHGGDGGSTNAVTITVMADLTETLITIAVVCNGGNNDGNGGDALGGNGGDVSANGGQGGEGGKVRQKCILVSTVVNVNPTIELSSPEFEPVGDK